MIFRRETKEPDEIWFVRFRQNENGDYEGYAPQKPKRMDAPYPGSGIYSAVIDGEWEDSKGYYAVWSVNPKLSELSFRLLGTAEQRVQLEGNPSLTIFEFLGTGNFGVTASFFDTEGKEIM